jgi:hypothetical protein
LNNQHLANGPLQRFQLPAHPLPLLPPAPPPPNATSLPLGRHPFNKNNIQVSNLGPMNLICSKCKAYHWKAEQLASSSTTNPRFGTCCFNGKIKLPSLHDLPPELHELYHGQDHIAKTFRDNIRRYNNALAMTSVGQSPGVPVQMDHTINHGGGPWLYKIKGALHHYAGSLVPNPQRPPRFAQLYIYDPQESLEHRISANTELNPQILQILQDLLYRKHPSVQKFK